MTIEVRCKCGRRFKAKPILAGKRVRCPVCEHSLRVPDASDTALVAENAQHDPPTENDDLWDALPDSVPAASPMSSDGAMSTAKKTATDQLLAGARAEQAERTKDLDSWATKKIISGISMMVLAFVWFGAGLLIGRILVFPAILFVVGVIALINGLGQKLHRET